MNRTQISLTDDDRRVLDAEAERTGRSIAALIREAVALTYSSERRLPADDLQAIDDALGAWAERGTDGQTYTAALRSGDRLRDSTARSRTS